MAATAVPPVSHNAQHLSRLLWMCVVDHNLQSHTGPVRMERRDHQQHLKTFLRGPFFVVFLHFLGGILRMLGFKSSNIASTSNWRLAIILCSRMVQARLM